MLLYPWPERFFPAAGEARVTCALIVANVVLSVLSNVCIRFGMMSFRAEMRGVLRHMMRTQLRPEMPSQSHSTAPRLPFEKA